MTKAVPVNRGGVASGLFFVEARGDNAAPFHSWAQSNALHLRHRRSHLTSGGTRAVRFGRDPERWDTGHRLPYPHARGISPRGDRFGDLIVLQVPTVPLGAPAYRGAAGVIGTGGVFNITVQQSDYDHAPQAGDIIVIGCALGASSKTQPANTINTPSGWTLLDSGPFSPAATAAATFWRTASGTSADNVTITANGSFYSALALAGANVSSIDVHALAI